MSSFCKRGMDVDEGYEGQSKQKTNQTYLIYQQVKEGALTPLETSASDV